MILSPARSVVRMSRRCLRQFMKTTVSGVDTVVREVVSVEGKNRQR